MSAIPLVVAALAAHLGTSEPTEQQWASCNEGVVEQRLSACELIAENRNFERYTRAYAAATLGDIHLDRRELAPAKSEFTRAIRLSPDYGYPHRRRAFVAFLENSYQEAEADFITAIELAPLDPYAFIARASFYRQTERTDLARLDIERALRLDLNNSDLYYERGLLSLDVRDYEQAELDFLKAVRLSPDDHDARYNLANALRFQSRTIDALREIEIYIKDEGQDPQGYRLRGWLNTDLERFDRAQADFVSALDLRPDDARLHYALGYVHWRRGAYQQALEAYRLAETDYDETAYFHYERGYARFMLNQDRLALDDANRAIELDDTNTDAMWLKGAALFYLEQYRDALAVLDKAVKIDPESADLLAMRGRVQIGAEHYFAAVGDLTRALEFNPGHSSAAAYRAYASGLAGYVGLARKTLDEIIDQQPEAPLTFELSARLLYQEKDFETARTYSERLLGLSPKDGSYLALHGDILLELGQYTEAARIYRAALSNVSEPPAGWLRLAAYSAILADEKGSAFKLLKQARLADPADSWTSGMLADFWLERSEFDKAMLDFDHAISGSDDENDRFAFHLGKAKALAGAGKRQAALDALTLLAKQKPDDTDVSWARANVLLELGRHEDAIVEFEHYRRRKPASLEAHYKLIDIMSTTGQHGDALKLADRVVYMERDKAKGYRIRGQIRFQMKNFDAAAEDLRKAIGLSPRSAEVHLMLARVLIAVSDGASALASLDAALGLEPGLAEAYYLKAIAYRMTGQVELALSALSSAIALDDGHLSPQIAGLKDKLR